jgi:hypothetical protein
MSAVNDLLETLVVQKSAVSKVNPPPPPHLKVEIMITCCLIGHIEHLRGGVI